MSHDIAWLNIKEASQMTGRSINSLNLLVNRHRIDKVRKINGRWHIHRDSIASLCQTISPTKSDIDVTMSPRTKSDIAILLEHYEGQRKEWLSERDQLQAGLMMYRYKYEEMEKQIRLLPAPAEITAMEQEKAAALARAQEILSEAQENYAAYEQNIAMLREKLAEEERVQAALRAELQRPWWKKMLGLK